MRLTEEGRVSRNPKELVDLFWNSISNAKYEDLLPLFHEDAPIYLPNTREMFEGPSQYIAFNQVYPGRWTATVERLLLSGEVALSITKVSSEDPSRSFFVTSWFEFRQGKILRLEEYWGENGSPPEWQRDGSLSKLY